MCSNLPLGLLRFLTARGGVVEHLYDHHAAHDYREDLLEDGRVLHF